MVCVTNAPRCLCVSLFKDRPLHAAEDGESHELRSLARRVYVTNRKVDHLNYTGCFICFVAGFRPQGAQVVEDRGPGQGRQGRHSGAGSSEHGVDTSLAGLVRLVWRVNGRPFANMEAVKLVKIRFSTFFWGHHGQIHCGCYIR